MYVEVIIPHITDRTTANKGVMNKTASIFTFRFFDFEKNCVRIGGTETYSLNLATLFTRMGYDTTVYISLNKPDKLNECTYHGFKVKEVAKGKSHDAAFQKIYSGNNGEGIYIVMTEDMKVNSKEKPNVITIQHGIMWDNPGWAYSKRYQKGFRFSFRKFYRCHRYICRFKMVSNMVCVDYNYYNWLRTLHEIPDRMHVTVIPNAAAEAITRDEFEKKLDAITDLKKSKIVFARRFTRFRGAEMFANVAKRLLEKYPGLDITIAGDGELEGMLRNTFEGKGNVHITKYSTEESIAFHKQFDIAIVPTIYSEGTSLSLCEAMAAGCLPMSSHVGGLTNIIIDSYNGRLFYPSEEAMYNTFEEVLNMDIGAYKRMLRNSYETCVSAFVKNTWEERWIKYINSLGL